MAKLTPNFDLSEFSKIQLNEYQLSLIQLLANNLQIVRDKLQSFKKVPSKNVSITISSGVRTAADYERLKANGHNPSANSDHFCGYQPGARPTLGAADIKVNNCSLSLKDVASLMIEWDKSGVVHFGQIIYEFNPATGGCWIHVGNDWKEIFKDGIKLNRAKYRMSLDNGKTYQEFK